MSSCTSWKGASVWLAGPCAAEERGAVCATAVVAGLERERVPVDPPAVGREVLGLAEAALRALLGSEPEHRSGERDEPGAEGGECLGAARATRPCEEDDAVASEARMPHTGGQRPPARAADVGRGQATRPKAYERGRDRRGWGDGDLC